MIYLTSSTARNLAEGAWGRSDATKAHRINRRGAYFLTCQRNFGFIIDDGCLTREERETFAAYSRPRPARVLSVPSGPILYWHEFKKRHVAAGQPVAQTWYWMFAGEPDWSIPVLFVGLAPSGASPSEILRWRLRAERSFMERECRSNAA